MVECYVIASECEAIRKSRISKSDLHNFLSHRGRGKLKRTVIASASEAIQLIHKTHQPEALAEGYEKIKTNKSFLINYLL